MKMNLFKKQLRHYLFARLWLFRDNASSEAGNNGENTENEQENTEQSEEMTDEEKAYQEYLDNLATQGESITQLDPPEKVRK